MGKALKSLLLTLVIITLILPAGCGFLSKEPETEPPAPGWEKHVADDFVLYMPSGWVGIGQDEYLLDLLMEPALSGLLEVGLPTEDSATLFRAYDAELVVPGRQTPELTVARMRTFFSLEDHMEVACSFLRDYLELMFIRTGIEVTIHDHEMVDLNPDSVAGRIIITAKYSGQRLHLVQYSVKDKHKVWVLTFGTEEEWFHEYEEIFDRIAGSFVLR